VLRFTDDTAIIADNKKHLKTVLKTGDKTFKNEIKHENNIQTTKTLLCGIVNNTRVRLRIDDYIEQVHIRKGSIISNNGRDKMEIVKRIFRAKNRALFLL